jgi:hypothetical protein
MYLPLAFINSLTPTYSLQAKPKVSLCLIKHHAMKTSAFDVGDLRHSPASFPLEKLSQYLLDKNRSRRCEDKSLLPLPGIEL